MNLQSLHDMASHFREIEMYLHLFALPICLLIGVATAFFYHGEKKHPTSKLIDVGLKEE